MRYFIHMAYDGGAYHGWQIQPNAITVQEVLNDALHKLLGNPNINVVGAGRTDTGVHASDYYAHFDIDNPISDLYDLRFKLNRFLKEDIAIYKLFPVKPDAHTRFDAISRTYHYYINSQKHPFKRKYSWYLYGDLDMNQMNLAAQKLIGKHDFTSFSKSNTQTHTNICDVMIARWTKQDDALIFEVKADRFLRNMVRALVGTLVDVGKGKLSVQNVQQILNAKDRREAGESVPGNALFLSHIEYDFNRLIQQEI
jgi:tRNA pseudouridine38-40 synthase